MQGVENRGSGRAFSEGDVPPRRKHKRQQVCEDRGGQQRRSCSRCLGKRGADATVVGLHRGYVVESCSESKLRRLSGWPGGW